MFLFESGSRLVVAYMLVLGFEFALVFWFVFVLGIVFALLFEFGLILGESVELELIFVEFWVFVFVLLG